MNVSEQLQRDFQAILDLVGDKLPIKYSNYCLEGPLNAPMNLSIVAALYPYKGPLEYRVMQVNDIGLVIKELRNKILNYELRPEVTQLQQELAAVWKVNIANGFFLQMKVREACSLDIPLVFITFGLAVDDNQLMAHIWHHPAIPTERCLKMIRECVLSTIHREN